MQLCGPARRKACRSFSHKKFVFQLLEVNGFPIPRLWPRGSARGSAGVFCLLDPQGPNCTGLRRGLYLSSRSPNIQCRGQEPAEKLSLQEESCFSKLGQTQLLVLTWIRRSTHSLFVSEARASYFSSFKMFSNFSFLKMVEIMLLHVPI